MNRFFISAAVINIVVLPLEFGYLVWSLRTMAPVSAIIFSHLEDPTPDIQSDYFFGKCAPHNKTFFTAINLTREDTDNIMVYRGYLNYRHSNDPYWDNYVAVPNCVIIRAFSAITEQMKYDPYIFNVCMCRLIVNYAAQKYTYVFFEWYIPINLPATIIWEVAFYLA